MIVQIKRSIFVSIVAFGTLSLPVIAQKLASIEVSQQAYGHERLFDGAVEAINQTTVSAQTGGRVIEINFDVDDVVEKDAILIKISDNEQAASATQAAASVSSARAQLSLAKNNFARFEALYQSQTIPKSQFDDASTALNNAQASLKTALAARDRAQKQVEYTVVRAPYSGIVTERLVELGETVGSGQALMSGFSTTALRVRTEVPNRFARSIQADQGVDVILDTQPPTRLHSTQLIVFPFANVQSNSVTVRVNLPQNVQGIYPGMLVKIAFQTESEMAISIPQSVIFSRSEITGVYVLDGDNIHLRRLSLGNAFQDEQGAHWVRVLSGLTLGERVALDPLAAIKRLKARTTANPAAEAH